MAFAIARRPEVRLLSIGEEPEKGNQLTLEAHALLAETPGIDFRGNTESRALLEHAADVVVCDGFTGNVALKLLEGTIKSLLDALREEIGSTARGKLGGLLIRPAARGLRSRIAFAIAVRDELPWAITVRPRSPSR